MTRSSLPGDQEAHEGMGPSHTLTSLLDPFVIWNAMVGACLQSLDYRSLFHGEYGLVTLRHIRLGFAAFSRRQAFEVFRGLLISPELDSPVRRWTRWIPLIQFSLSTCLAPLLAMLYSPGVLMEAGRSCPTSSYKSRPLLSPFFVPLAELITGLLGLVWTWSCTLGINWPVAAYRRVMREEERPRGSLVTSQRVHFAAARMITGAVTLGVTLLGPAVGSVGPLASLSVTWPVSMWVLEGAGIAAVLISALWSFCRTRQGNDPYLVMKWIDYLVIIVAIVALLTVLALLPEAQCLFLFSRF